MTYLQFFSCIVCGQFTQLLPVMTFEINMILIWKFILSKLKYHYYVYHTLQSFFVHNEIIFIKVLDFCIWRICNHIFS